MAKRTVRYTDLAIDDLDIIFSYISEDNRTAAQNMAEKLEKRILMLADNPRMGATLPSSELRREEGAMRYIAIKPYLAFYRILDNSIIVVRILHSRQDWLNLLLAADM